MARCVCVDFESQQSILKWVRTVPGPLQDVMKNQQATCVALSLVIYCYHKRLRRELTDWAVVLLWLCRLDAEHSGQFVSGGSMGSGAMISTVFDDGPWVDMCDFLRIPTTRGKLYGALELLVLYLSVPW